MAQRLLSVMAAATGILVIAVATAATAHAGCGDEFPDTEWRVVGETELLVVATTESVGEGEGLRFADTASQTVRWLEEDFGTVPRLDLCVFSQDDGLDPAGLAPRGQLLHAVAFTETGTVYINTLQSGRFNETQGFGLAYVTLWEIAGDQGLDGYPEPLATVIGQWYLARAAGKLELHHAQMRGGAFFRDPTGEGVDATDWAQASQPPTYAWNPQFQESPISDLVQWAVDQHGVEVLSDPDPARWGAIEQAWQDALREEALQGASGGSDWLIGGAIFFGFIGLAALMAGLTRRAKRRAREEARRRAEAEAAPHARTTADRQA